MNIKEDNTLKLNKYRDYPPNPSYIAGFIDGDGTIFIRKIKDGYQSGISISQSRTNILQILQYHYGGTIIKPNELYNEDIFDENGYYDKNNKRNSYTLIFRSNEYKFLLNDIKDHIILKKIQIDVLNDFSILVNKTELNDEKEKLYKLCSSKNEIKVLEEYDYSKMNIEYIQGLFDSEGHIFISPKKINNELRFTKSVYMKITQKNHPKIIDAIHNFLGFGKKSDFIYYVDTFKDCLKLISLLKKNLIVKYNQIIAFEEYLKTRLSKEDNYSNEIHLKRESYYRIINMEKHIIEVYEEEEIENKNGLLLKINEEDENSKIQKELEKKINNQKKSESMQGVNNPNYGKQFSDTHALNLSLSITKLKRANNPNLSNEKIREIYALKNTGIMQKDVAEKYSMNREMIRRIWNKSIIPTDDEDFIKKKEELIISKKSTKNDELSFEQKTSIGKRSLSSEQYIEIMLMKQKRDNNELYDGKRIYSTTLAQHLSKLWDKKVTIDMIKNAWTGKTKLFEFDFNEESPIRYDKYCELIDKK
jgi:hypothetical protein